METLPHPTTLSIPQEQLRQDFVRISHTQLPEVQWHFETVLPKGTRVGPPAKAPVAGGEVQRLAIFNQPDPPCDVEFFGVHLTRDINPADWLDLWLEKQPHAKVVSRKRMPYIGGAIGDVLATWDVNGVQWVGRFFITKVGPRVFLLWARVAEADYARMAEAIFLAIMSFRVLDTSAGPLAEGIVWANGPTPVAWKAALPVSWQGVAEPGNAQSSAFQANLMGPSVEGAAPQIQGKLTFVILAPEVVKDAADLGAKSLQAVRSSGVVMEGGEFVEEPASESYTGAWYLSDKGALNGMPVAVHGRILRHPKAWISAMVVSPSRELSPLLWMQARRVLDIVTMTLVVG